MSETHHFEKAIYVIVSIYFACFTSASFIFGVISRNMPKIPDHVSRYGKRIDPIVLFITHSKFSIIHTVIDFVILFYITLVKPQHFIALLVLLVMIGNALQYNYTRIRYWFQILDEFHI
eukprot:107712_1